MTTALISELERVLDMATRHSVCSEVIRGKKNDLLVGFGTQVLPELVEVERVAVEDPLRILRHLDEEHVMLRPCQAPYTIRTFSSKWSVAVGGSIFTRNDIDECFDMVVKALIGKSVVSYNLNDRGTGVEFTFTDMVGLKVEPDQTKSTAEDGLWAVEAGRGMFWFCCEDQSIWVQTRYEMPPYGMDGD